MPFNFDTSGLLEEKQSNSEKIQHLLAAIIALDWDNLDTDDWAAIEYDLNLAHYIAEQKLNNILENNNV